MGQRPQNLGSDVLTGLAPSPEDSAKECFMRAKQCSRLAKQVTGPLQRKLYRFKNMNLAAAFARAPSQFTTTVDHHRYPGLLSVSCNDNPSIRVHTHENWLASA